MYVASKFSRNVIVITAMPFTHIKICVLAADIRICFGILAFFKYWIRNVHWEQRCSGWQKRNNSKLQIFLQLLDYLDEDSSPVKSLLFGQ